MKPQRVRMTHALLKGYELYRLMDVIKPHRASETEISYFHDTDYVNFLSVVTAENAREFLSHTKRFNVGDQTDCPIFPGLFEFQQSCAGASIDAAARLNTGKADICINWSGGLHHAKRAEASGFCYINDIVLSILELLKYHPRVMYIDIDIHHGDGVEEAFYTTHRVMTVSFHKFGDFFPGTGDITDVGTASGKYYAVNIPLNDGIQDQQFLDLFKPIISKAVEVYRPSAIVMQCGADSVYGDRLGKFSLSIKGHAECVAHVQSFNIPLLILGGGGYTIRNVARTWAYETAVILKQNVPNTLPFNDYYDYYGPEYLLHLPVPHQTNLNSKEHLDSIRTRVLENLSRLQHAPGVEFSYVPPNFFQPSHDPDEYAQNHVDFEGGGKAADMSRKKRAVSKLSRTKSGSYQNIHLVRKSDHALEFYDEKPNQLEAEHLDIEPGVALTDDANNQKFDEFSE
ncbi:histone deacetylase 1-like [Danaus plexippus]|uniref:histone deacetylase 1-like n=1 Tax=Danaus plexippus TaxID=13037 RepID=UPI002AAF3931|nr:histone deacetylase 1-like [Danaus plexippus]